MWWLAYVILAPDVETRSIVVAPAETLQVTGLELFGQESPLVDVRVVTLPLAAGRS